MEETNEKLPNFSIGIDLLRPDPTSSKNKAEFKKLASCAFHKFVGRPAAANFGRETFTGNRKDTNLPLTKKVKFPCLLLFLNLLCTFVIAEQCDSIRKISLAITRQITQEDKNLLLIKTTAARSSQVAVMTSHCS